MSCAAPEQGPLDETSGGDGPTVIQGRVVRGSDAVPSAFVRLLDGSGEFTAEVVSGAAGQFRFFAAPGRWTVRALAPGSAGTADVSVGRGTTTVDVALEPA